MSMTVKINATIDLPKGMSLEDLQEKVESGVCTLIIEEQGIEDEIELGYATLEETND